MVRTNIDKKPSWKQHAFLESRRFSPHALGRKVETISLMKNLFLIIAASTLIVACSKNEVPAPAATPGASTAPSTVSPPPAAAPTAGAAADALPAECQAYMKKVETCLSKQSQAAADAVKRGFEQAKASWSAMAADKAALGASCKAADDAFAQQATAMKC